MATIPNPTSLTALLLALSMAAPALAQFGGDGADGAFHPASNVALDTSASRHTASGFFSGVHGTGSIRRHGYAFRKARIEKRNSLWSPMHDNKRLLSRVRSTRLLRTKPRAAAKIIGGPTLGYMYMPPLTESTWPVM